MKSLTSLALAFCLLFAACSKNSDHPYSRWFEKNGKLKVLCTVGMIQDVVQQVGGGHIDCLTVVQGELDPHSYELVKGDDEKFAFAELIFYNGLGLEHGPSMRRQLEKSEKAIGLGDRIFSEEPSLILDIGGQPDPHIWMDIGIWMKTVPIILEALKEARPEHAASFQKNADALLREMASVDNEIRSLLLEIPHEQRFLVTSHDAFNYFARQYLATPEEWEDGSWEKRCEAPEGLAPEGQLSTVDIQRLIDHLDTHQINVLFPESNVSKDSINKIVHAGREKGLEIRVAQEHLYADAMGAPGSEGENYLKMIHHNAKTIAKHLRGDVQP